MSFDGPAGSQNYVTSISENAAKQVDFITIDGLTTPVPADANQPRFSALRSKQDPSREDLDIEATVNATSKRVYAAQVHHGIAFVC